MVEEAVSACLLRTVMPEFVAMRRVFRTHVCENSMPWTGLENLAAL